MLQNTYLRELQRPQSLAYNLYTQTKGSYNKALNSALHDAEELEDADTDCERDVSEAKNLLRTPPATTSSGETPTRAATMSSYKLCVASSVATLACGAAAFAVGGGMGAVALGVGAVASAGYAVYNFKWSSELIDLDNPTVRDQWQDTVKTSKFSDVLGMMEGKKVYIGGEKLPLAMKHITRYDLFGKVAPAEGRLKPAFYAALNKLSQARGNIQTLYKNEVDKINADFVRGTRKFDLELEQAKLVQGQSTSQADMHKRVIEEGRVRKNKDMAADADTPNFIKGATVFYNAYQDVSAKSEANQMVEQSKKILTMAEQEHEDKVRPFKENRDNLLADAAHRQSKAMDTIDGQITAMKNYKTPHSHSAARGA